jgi:glyoxylase-like metal-dependent hydrolase (beta-lactamase superfamily II)
MAVTSVAPGLHIVPAGAVNAYLIEDQGGLTLIDTGFPDKQQIILDAVRAIGHAPRDVKNIVLTHAHVDHIGGLAALKAATGARTWMHGLDAPLARSGGPFRPMTPAKGLLPGLLFRIFVKPGATVEPSVIDHEVEDGEMLPLAGGLRVIHVPGHCAGQIALLWEKAGVLFVADACLNLLGLGPPLGWENAAQGQASQKRLGTFAYDIACFGHGKPIVRDAAAQIRRKFG